MRGFGFSTLQTTLVSTCPAAVIQLSTFLIFSYIASHKKNLRLWLSMIVSVPPLIGASLLHSLPESNQAGRLAGYYLTYTWVNSLLEPWSCGSLSKAHYVLYFKHRFNGLKLCRKYKEVNGKRYYFCRLGRWPSRRSPLVFHGEGYSRASCWLDYRILPWQPSTHIWACLSDAK